jgi:hypothetical protein
MKISKYFVAITAAPEGGSTALLLTSALVLGFLRRQATKSLPTTFAVRTCLLGVFLALTPLSQAVPTTTRFTGTVFSAPVVNPFGSSLGDAYVMLINYDPDLLTGVPVGDFTKYESAAGETLITFSWISAGDTFTSDNSFPVTIFINNEPPAVTADQFTLSGHIDPMTTLNLNLVASFGEDPLSSENLPTTSADWGDGVGSQWTVAEIFIDRGFDRLSSGISTLEVVNSVPDSGSSLFLLGASSLVLAGLYQRKTKAVHSSYECSCPSGRIGLS